MEPQVITITITPHEDPYLVSFHVEWRGIFSDEATVAKGQVGVTRVALGSLVYDELRLHHDHEIACKALGYV